MYILMCTNLKECCHSDLTNPCKVGQYILNVKLDLKYCYFYHVHCDYNTSSKQQRLQPLRVGQNRTILVI